MGNDRTIFRRSDQVIGPDPSADGIHDPAVDAANRPGNGEHTQQSKYIFDHVAMLPQPKRFGQGGL